jgi:precorrin-6B methylase 2
MKERGHYVGAIDTAQTPLRGMKSVDDEGVRVIRDAGSTWLDGSEVGLLTRMRSGLPLGSMTSDLFATAVNWPERYHTSPARANIVRALRLPEEADVLEVGAGCGAITRYLGETCARVDALEPTLARARVAAARTFDLSGVTVFCAEVSDVPSTPAYDLVVVVGVLEYVGGGGRARSPYVEFLRALRALLKPGGRIVVAIENPVGVKYLSGAPEDHSGRVFHSVEGYPVDGPARTFTRKELRELAVAAGFTSTQMLGAFPDYKLTRAVFADALFEAAPALALEVPHFPSPDWGRPRPHLVDEAALWAELVATGHGAEFSNSLVLVAESGGSKVPLWDSDQLAAYFSLNRRPELQVRKEVRSDAEAISIVTVPLGVGNVDGLTVLAGAEPFIRGQGVLNRLLADPSELGMIVADWRRVVGDAVASSTGSIQFDLLPHNLMYREGVAHVIDDEWRSTGVTENQVLARGALLLARDLAELRGHAIWGATSRRDLAERIAKGAGLAVDDEWFERSLDQEATLQALIGGGGVNTSQFDATRAGLRKDLVEVFAREIEGRGDRPRAWERLEILEREAIETRDLLFETGRQLDASRAENSQVKVHSIIRRANLRGGRILRAVRRRLQPGRNQ